MAYTVLSSGKGGVLVEDTDNLIQTSEAERDLPKEEIQETSDAEVLHISKRFIEQNSEAYEVLAQ